MTVQATCFTMQQAANCMQYYQSCFSRCELVHSASITSCYQSICAFVLGSRKRVSLNANGKKQPGRLLLHQPQPRRRRQQLRTTSLRFLFRMFRRRRRHFVTFLFLLLLHERGFFKFTVECNFYSFQFSKFKLFTFDLKVCLRSARRARLIKFHHPRLSSARFQKSRSFGEDTADGFLSKFLAKLF